MTEYDFSPQAYDRYLASQTRISSWVDETNGHSPANPFLPLPGEHGSVVSPNSHPPSSSTTSSPHHTTRYGPASPVYISHSSGSSQPKHSHQTRHGRSSFQPSPQFGIPVSLGGGLYTAATQAQIAQPMRTGPSVTKSHSTLPSVIGLPYHSSHPPQNTTYFYATSPYAPSVTGSTPMQHSVTSPSHQIRTQPFAQVYSPAYTYQYQYSPPPLTTSDTSPGNVHSASPPAMRTDSVQSLLLSPTPSSGGVSYVQPHPHQPIVIPLGEGGKNGYIVVPAAGQQVQVIVSIFNFPTTPNLISNVFYLLFSTFQNHAQYPSPGEGSDNSDKEHGTQSFFGSLGLGKKAKGSSRKENKSKTRKSKT
jgi:hypothetical protein